MSRPPSRGSPFQSDQLITQLRDIEQFSPARVQQRQECLIDFGCVLIGHDVGDARIVELLA